MYVDLSWQNEPSLLEFINVGLELSWIKCGLFSVFWWCSGPGLTLPLFQTCKALGKLGFHWGWASVWLSKLNLDFLTWPLTALNAYWTELPVLLSFKLWALRTGTKLKRKGGEGVYFSIQFFSRLNGYCLLCVIGGIMQLYLLGSCCSIPSMHEFGNWLWILSCWAHVKCQLSCIYRGIGMKLIQRERWAFCFCIFVMFIECTLAYTLILLCYAAFELWMFDFCGMMPQIWPMFSLPAVT